MSEDPPRADGHTRQRAFEAAFDLVASPERAFEATLNAVLELGCEVLGTDYATLSRVHPDAGTYVFERVAVPPDSAIADGHRAALADLPNCAAVVEREASLVVEDVPEQRPDLADPTYGIACYLGAPVTVEGTVYGTLCFYDTEPRDAAFPEWTVEFVETLAGWASGELARQRTVDHLEALVDLDAVVRDTTARAFEAEDRRTIESTACRHLAESAAYEGAWIGEPAPAEPALSVRAVAGLERASTADTVPFDPPDEPDPAAAEAYETASPTLVRDPAPDSPPPTAPPFTPDGVSAVLAAPITYDGIVRGVLVVHADRARAFAGREREILADFATQLGHAIAATQRERVVGSDAVSELTIRLDDPLGAYGIEGPPDPVVIADLLRRGDGGFVGYGRTTADGLAALRDLADAHPDVQDVARLGEREDGIAFQVTGAEFPLLSRVYARGGTVERAVLEAGAVRLTVHLPTDVETRQLVRAAQERAEAADVVAKQTVSRAETAVDRTDLLATLTDRQLTALRAAYDAGFYERPRETSSKSLAEALDVAPATFSQQRRVAESKLLAAIFEDGPE